MPNPIENSIITGEDGFDPSSICGPEIEDIRVIHPANFPEVYARRQQDQLAQKMLQASGDLFLCQAPDIAGEFVKLWIIDGDDTLWEDNIYYEKLASELADYLSDKLPHIVRGDVRKLLDQVEHEIIPVHGFGPLGFKLSVEETFRRICDQHGTIDTPFELFERIIPLLSGVPYAIDNDIMLALKELRVRGDGLVLFTQGPLEIQQGKIARSGLAPLFHALAVGSNKNDATYSCLIDSLACRGKEISVVGNSLKSEVLPALRLGLKGVHYKNSNSWHAVNNVTVTEGSFDTVDSIRGLLNL